MAEKTKQVGQFKEIEVSGVPMWRTGGGVFVPETLDRKNRIVEVVWSTGARVLTPGENVWDEPYFEELSLEEGQVRLDRLNNGCAVLNSHGRGEYLFGGPGLEDQIGSVIPGSAVVVSPTEARAKIHITDTPELARIWSGIEQGDIRNVSARYTVWRYRDVTQPDDRLTVLRAIDWEPEEVSILPIGADAGSGVRAKSAKSHPIVIEVRSNRSTKPTMDDPDIEEENAEGEEATEETGAETATETEDDQAGGTTTEEDADKPADAPKDGARAKAERKKGAKMERARTAGIQQSARLLGFKQDDPFVKKLIDSETELDGVNGARAQLFSKRQEAEKEDSVSGHIQVGTDEGDKIGEAVTHALEYRSGVRARKDLSAAAKSVVNYRLCRMAEEFMVRRGQTDVRGLPDHRIAARAMNSTSDFPLIFANIANLTLLAGYESEARNFDLIADRRDAPDFRPMNFVRVSGAPNLEKVPEGGEIKRGTLKEGGEAAVLESYGKAVPFTRRMMINDQIGAFNDMVRAFGAAAIRLELDIFWALFTANPILGDGFRLFSSDHNNVLNTTALNLTTLKQARALGRKQTGLVGERLNVDYPTLLVPPDQETIALQLTSATTPQQTEDVNTFAGTIKDIIAEPRLEETSALRWYMAGNKARFPAARFGYLQGNNGPMIDSEIDFKTKRFEIQVLHDFFAVMFDHVPLMCSEDPQG